MASKRIWTDMFKVHHDDAAFTQGASEPIEVRQTKARWCPKKEQIEILESIFKSGKVNPTRTEIQRIRNRLLDFGEVGDANVFYWFQNRKSRFRKRQRRSNAAKENADGSSSSILTRIPNAIQASIANPIHTRTSNPIQASTANPIHTSNTNPIIQTGIPNPIHTRTPNPIQASTANPNHTSTPNLMIQTSIPNPIHTSTPDSLQTSMVPSPIHTSTLSPIQTSMVSNPIQTMENPSFPTLPASVSSFPTMPAPVAPFSNQQIQQTQQDFADALINLQQDAMFGGVRTYPYNYNSAIPAFPQDYSSFLPPEMISYPLNYYQCHEAVMPSALTDTRPDTRLGSGNDDLITVTIDGMKFKAPRGPINIRAAFGQDAFLVDIVCERILTDDRGFTLYGLQDGGVYYLLSEIGAAAPSVGFSQV